MIDIQTFATFPAEAGFVLLADGQGTVFVMVLALHSFSSIMHGCAEAKHSTKFQIFLLIPYLLQMIMQKTHNNVVLDDVVKRPYAPPLCWAIHGSCCSGAVSCTRQVAPASFPAFAKNPADLERVK